MIISNPSGGFGAGGNKTNKARLKSGRVFYFSSEHEANQFCKRNDLNLESIVKDGKTYKLTIQ